MKIMHGAPAVVLDMVPIETTQAQMLGAIGLGVLLLLLILGITKPQWLASLLTHVQLGIAQAAEWCKRTIDATLRWGSHWGRQSRQDEDAALFTDSQSLDAADGEDRRTVWSGFIIIARCVYLVTAGYLLLAAFSLDSGRSCAVQFGEDCAIHLPIDASSANGALWFLGIGFFGGLLAEAIGWLAPQLHLVPSPTRFARWALGAYAALGTSVGLSGATLLAVIAQMQLQHIQWQQGVEIVTLLQAVVVNWAIVGAGVALIFGLGGAIALVLQVIQLVCEVLHFLFGLLLRLVRREAGRTVSIEGETPDANVLPAVYVMGVGRPEMRFERAVVSELQRLKVGKALGGYGGFNPQRLQSAPIKVESGLDLSISQRDVSAVRAASGGRADPAEESALLCVAFLRKVIRRVLERRQSRGQLLLCLGAEHLEGVVPAIDQLHTAVPHLTIVPLIRLPDSGSASRTVASGLQSMLKLQEERRVAPVMVFDAHSPLVQSRKVAGEESQERLLVSAIAATLAASIQDPDQPTLAEIVATIAQQHRSVGVRTFSASVPVGREAGLYKLVAGRDAPRRGYGDVGVALEQALDLARRLQEENELRTTDVPLEACGGATALTFEVPIRSVDTQRWKVFCDGIRGELPGIAPGALALFTHGAGAPLDRTVQDGYTEQVTVWFGMDAEDWAQPYLEAEQTRARQSAGNTRRGGRAGQNGDGRSVARLQPLPPQVPRIGRERRRRVKQDALQDPMSETWG